MNIFKAFVLMALSAGILSEAGAKDTLDLKGMNIKGDAEEPQVLYIVPWQEADINELEQQLKLDIANSRYLDRFELLRALEVHNMVSKKEN